MYKINEVDYIMDFESGDISFDNFLKLFCNLVESGQASKLQGYYGRTAQSLLNRQFIIKKNNHYIINSPKVAEFLNN